jgi:hypothetical protein
MSTLQQRRKALEAPLLELEVLLLVLEVGVPLLVLEEQLQVEVDWGEAGLVELLDLEVGWYMMLQAQQVAVLVSPEVQLQDPVDPGGDRIFAALFSSSCGWWTEKEEPWIRREYTMQ